MHNTCTHTQTCTFSLHAQNSLILLLSSLPSSFPSLNYCISLALFLCSFYLFPRFVKRWMMFMIWNQTNYSNAKNASRPHSSNHLCWMRGIYPMWCHIVDVGLHPGKQSKYESCEVVQITIFGQDICSQSSEANPHTNMCYFLLCWWKCEGFFCVCVSLETLPVRWGNRKSINMKCSRLQPLAKNLLPLD